VCPHLTLFASAFASVGARLPSRCLATAVFSGFTIPALRRHVSLHLNVVGRVIFSAVRLVSDIVDLPEDAY
jgi:hypothetical protein